MTEGNFAPAEYRWHRIIPGRGELSLPLQSLLWKLFTRATDRVPHLSILLASPNTTTVRSWIGATHVSEEHVADSLSEWLPDRCGLQETADLRSIVNEQLRRVNTSLCQLDASRGHENVCGHRWSITPNDVLATRGRHAFPAPVIDPDRSLRQATSPGLMPIAKYVARNGCPSFWQLEIRPLAFDRDVLTESQLDSAASVCPYYRVSCRSLTIRAPESEASKPSNATARIRNADIPPLTYAGEIADDTLPTAFRRLITASADSEPSATPVTLNQLDWAGNIPSADDLVTGNLRGGRHPCERIPVAAARQLIPRNSNQYENCGSGLCLGWPMRHTRDTATHPIVVDKQFAPVRSAYIAVEDTEQSYIPERSYRLVKHTRQLAEMQTPVILFDFNGESQTFEGRPVSLTNLLTGHIDNCQNVEHTVAEISTLAGIKSYEPRHPSCREQGIDDWKTLLDTICCLPRDRHDGTIVVVNCATADYEAITQALQGLVNTICNQLPSANNPTPPRLAIAIGQAERLSKNMIEQLLHLPRYPETLPELGVSLHLAFQAADSLSQPNILPETLKLLEQSTDVRIYASKEWQVGTKARYDEHVREYFETDHGSVAARAAPHLSVIDQPSTANDEYPLVVPTEPAPASEACRLLSRAALDERVCRAASITGVAEQLRPRSVSAPGAGAGQADAQPPAGEDSEADSRQNAGGDDGGDDGGGRETPLPWRPIQVKCDRV